MLLKQETRGKGKGGEGREGEEIKRNGNNIFSWKGVTCGASMISFT